jgi:hypothetical protein
MHLTAISNADAFFKNYLPNLSKKPCVSEISSQDVHGGIYTVCQKIIDVLV